MTAEEFKVQFPNLYEVLEWISTDNGMKFAAQITLDTTICTNYEVVASQLNAKEKETMGQGDDSERVAVIAKHGLFDFEEWLADVFDGPFSKQVWRQR